MAIVGIVAVLHLWVFAALALMKPVQPEPKPMSVSFVSRSAEVAGAAGGAEAVQQDQSGELVAPTAQANQPT